MTDKVLDGAERAGQVSREPAGDEHVLRRELSGDAELVEPVLQRRCRVASSGAADPLHHQHQRGAGACRWQREAGRLGRLPPRRRSERIRQRGARRGRDGDDRRARRCPHGDEHAGDKAAAAPEAAWPVDTFFDDFHKLSEYVNGEPVDPLSREGGQHRRRQLRLLPPLRGHRRRQPLLDDQLSAHRHDEGRHDPGRDRRPQPHPRSRRSRSTDRRAARGSSRAADGCRTPPTSRRIATCW